MQNRSFDILSDISFYVSQKKLILVWNDIKDIYNDINTFLDDSFPLI